MSFNYWKFYGNYFPPWDPIHVWSRFTTLCNIYLLVKTRGNNICWMLSDLKIPNQHNIGHKRSNYNWVRPSGKYSIIRKGRFQKKIFKKCKCFKVKWHFLGPKGNEIIKFPGWNPSIRYDQINFLLETKTMDNPPHSFISFLFSGMSLFMSVIVHVFLVWKKAY